MSGHVIVLEYITSLKGIILYQSFDKSALENISAFDFSIAKKYKKSLDRLMLVFMKRNTKIQIMLSTLSQNIKKIMSLQTKKHAI